MPGTHTVPCQTFREAALAVARRRPVLTLRREDGRVVAESVAVADTTARRLRGLLGKRDLARGSGILLRPAWSIHTAFMRFPIDVVFLDPDQVVIKIVPELRSFKTAGCRGAREIVELRAGEAERRGLQIGDRVAWAARPSWDEGASSEGVLGGDRPFAAPGRRGLVVLGSDDHRFAKLLRFMLDGRGVDLVETVRPGALPEAASEHHADVAVVDAGERVSEGLRFANATRASRPEAGIVVVAASVPPGQTGGIEIHDKWNATEAAVDEIVSAVDARVHARAAR